MCTQDSSSVGTDTSSRPRADLRRRSRAVNGRPACAVAHGRQSSTHLCGSVYAPRLPPHVRAVTVVSTRSDPVEQVPDAVLPGPAGAVVEVEATAICGSDLHFYDGDLPMYPVAVGHEAIGDGRRGRSRRRAGSPSATGCWSPRSPAAAPAQGCATRRPGRRASGARRCSAPASSAAPRATCSPYRPRTSSCSPIPDGVSDEAALLLTDNLGTGWAGATARRLRAPATRWWCSGSARSGSARSGARSRSAPDGCWSSDPVAGRRARPRRRAPPR